MILIRAPLETAELQVFVTVVEAGSLTRAATELGLPRVTAGRRLARLEERLGVRLLRRTTRKLALTDAGEDLYRRAREVLAAVEEAEQAVRADGVVRGLLRVAVPPMDNGGLRRMLLDFARAYPAVRMEVSASSVHTDLIAGRFDVALRAGALLDPGLVARVLARARMIAVASPAYLARAGTPSTPDELELHATVVGFARGEHPATHWPLLDGGQVRVRGVFTTNDLALQRDAALAGLGIALLPEQYLQGHLDRGELVEVLAGKVGTSTQIALVYPERELVPPAVRAFVRFVTEGWPRLALSGVAAR